MRETRLFQLGAIALIATTWLAACSSDSARQTCLPNDQQPCQCEPGSDGFQICNAEGTAFDVCQCSPFGVGGDVGQGGAGGAGGIVNPGVCTSSVPLLSHNIVDAEYSDTLDRIVAISTHPAALHLIDARQGDETSLLLDRDPTAVSLSPDGLHAAVGHTGRLSVVDLSSLTITAHHTVSADVFDIVHAGNGYAYAFPESDQWVTIRSVELATGVESSSMGLTIWERTKAKLHPAGLSVYGAINGLSPDDLERYDVSQGPASYAYDSAYHGDYDICGDLWFSASGDLIFTRCGNIFVTSNQQQQDMVYDGSIGVDPITHLSHAPLRGEVALIPSLPVFDEQGDEDTVLRLFAADSLTQRAALRLPCIAAATEVAGHGRFVFPLADGSGYAVILEPEEASVAVPAAAVAIVSPDN